jgi:hypothetical protein
MRYVHVIQFIFIQSHVILFNKMHLLFVIYNMIPLQTGLVRVEIERRRHGTRRSRGHRIRWKVRRAESEDERT